MDKIIGQIINKVPNLVWPLIVALSIYGLFVLVKNVYELYSKKRKNFIDELREHIEFKDQRLNEYKNYSDELKERVEHQQLIAQQNLSLAININEEKNVIRQQLTDAMFMALWMYEREKFVRRILTTILSKCTLPEDILDFLNSHINDVYLFSDFNERIYNQVTEIQQQGDFFDTGIIFLSNSFRQFLIIEEQKIMGQITESIQSLSSMQHKSPATEGKSA